MGNQHPNGSPLPGQTGNAEDIKDQNGRPSFPNLTGDFKGKSVKSVKLKKKKSVSPPKKNRSLTPTKKKTSKKDGGSLNELIDPISKSKEKNRALTPMRLSVKKESDPGLATIARDLIRSQVNKKKMSLLEITNINKTIKFVEFHQTRHPEPQDIIHLVGGPLLGYDLPAIEDITPRANNATEGGRMSFSNDSNDFKQKFSFRTDIYKNAYHNIKLNELNQNPRFQGDRDRAIMQREEKLSVAAVSHSRGRSELGKISQTNSQVFEVGSGPGREREFSPEFFFPKDSIMSRNGEWDSRTLKKLLKQDSKKESKEESEKMKRLKGAALRVEERKSSQTGKNLLASKRSAVSSKNVSQENSRNNSISQSKSATSMRKTSVTARDKSAPNTRATSPGLSVGKLQEDRLKKKGVPVISPKERAVSATKTTSVTSKQTGKIPPVNSKKQSVASVDEKQISSKVLTKKPVPQLTIQTSEDPSPTTNLSIDYNSIRKQPQTARYETKKYWKEAERPTSTSSKRGSIKKDNSPDSNEKRQFSKNVKELRESLQGGTKKASSPLANEYVKYLNTSSNQSVNDSKIPVKIFDLNNRKYSAPQGVAAQKVQVDNVQKVNQTVPIYTTDRDSNFESYGVGHIIDISNQLVSESRDLADTSDDDIQPIEATLDLSEFIVNSTATGQEYDHQRQRAPKEKGFYHPLLQEKGLLNQERRISQADSSYMTENEVKARRNTEPVFDSRIVWDPKAQEFKMNPDVYNNREDRKGSVPVYNVAPNKGKHYEHNQDYGNNNVEDDDDNFVNEIKRKMDFITGKIDSIPEKGRLNSQNKGEPQRAYYQEAYYEAESKENDAYKINREGKRYVMNDKEGGRKTVFHDVNIQYEREPSLRDQARNYRSGQYY